MGKTNIIFFTTALWLLCASAAAQTNFLPGYYINTNSDTVRGVVELRAESKMVRSIRFKRSLTSKVLVLQPTMATLVVIDGKNFYESHKVEGRAGEDEIVGFFKVRITGKITLYALDGQYFAKKGNDALFNITKRKRRIENKIQTDFSGLGLLKAYTADCPKLTEQYLVDQYTLDPDYVAIVAAYNSCSEETYLESPDIILKGELMLGVQGSAGLMMMEFNSTKSTLTEADFGAPIAGNGGLFVSYFSPKLGDQIRLVAEPSFGMYSGYAFFENGSGNNDLFIRTKYIRVPLIFRYFFGDHIYLDLGVTNFFPFAQDHTWRTESPAINGVITTSVGPEYILRRQSFGLLAGVGAKINIANTPVFLSGRWSFTFGYPEELDPNQPVIRGLEVNLAVPIFRK